MSPAASWRAPRTRASWTSGFLLVASGVNSADRHVSWYVPVVLRKPLMLIPALLLAALAPFLIATDQSLGLASAATPHSELIGPRRPAVVSQSHLPLVGAVNSGPSVQVTMPPVGLSIEYPVLAEDLGTGACPPAALVTELLRLGSPPLALAGASQDLTVPSGALTGPSLLGKRRYCTICQLISGVSCTAY